MKKINDWQRLSLAFMVCVLATVAVFLMGCDEPCPYTVVITPTSSLDGSVTIDLVGICASEKGLWEGYSVEKYFTQGDSLRNDAVKLTYKWTPEDKRVIRLEKTDPIWKKWILDRRVTHLVVLVDLPGGKDDVAKRLIITLGKKNTPGEMLPIEVSASRVVLLAATK